MLLNALMVQKLTNMKRIIYLLLIFVAVVSCTKAQNKRIEIITFDTIVVKEKIKLFPNKPDSVPYATLDIKFVYPIAFGSEEQLQKLQYLFCEEVLGEQYAKALLPESAVNNYVKDYVDMCLDYGAECYEDNLEYGAEGVTNYISISNYINYKSETVISFSASTDEYQCGAANSSYFQKNVVVNLKRIEVIREEDIFIAGYEESLGRVVREKLLEYMREEGYDDDEEAKEEFIDFDNISPNGNFLMDNKGLYYTYDPEEIAYRPAGMFEVFIPYSEIADLLNFETLAKLLPNIDLQKK